jgi:hypothetical protein
MRLAGITFGLAMGAAGAFLVALGALNIWYFVLSSGEIPREFHLGVGLAFTLGGAALGWVGWSSVRRT